MRTRFEHTDGKRQWEREKRASGGVRVFLITGPEHIGKYDFARDCAGDLLDIDVDRLESHTDMTILRAEQEIKGKLTAETTRDVLQTLRTPPVRAQMRVVIIEGIETLSVPGQNALLKSIEEPVVPTAFFLIARSLEQVLQTVRSRSIHLPLSFISHDEWPEEMRAFFENQSPVAQAYLEGRPELATRMMGKKRESGKIEKAIQDIDLFLNGSFGKRLAHARVIAKKQDHKALAVYLEDVLLVAHRMRMPVALQRAIAESRALTARHLNKTFILDHIIFSTI